MTEPTAARPVPGPYRPNGAPAPVPAHLAPAADGAPAARAPGTEPPAAGAPAGPGEAEAPEQARRLADLGVLPVAEHVAVFEAEHARLQRELGTIDPR